MAVVKGPGNEAPRKRSKVYIYVYTVYIYMYVCLQFFRNEKKKVVNSGRLRTSSKTSFQNSLKPTQALKPGRNLRLRQDACLPPCL